MLERDLTPLSSTIAGGMTYWREKAAIEKSLNIVLRCDHSSNNYLLFNTKTTTRRIPDRPEIGV